MSVWNRDLWAINFGLVYNVVFFKFTIFDRRKGDFLRNCLTFLLGFGKLIKFFFWGLKKGKLICLFFRLP